MRCKGEHQASNGLSWTRKATKAQGEKAKRSSKAHIKTNNRPTLTCTDLQAQIVGYCS